MKLYNTYTNTLEEFKPIKEKELSIYVCGPTVYNYIHIGNARPIIFFDVLRRYFEYKGYKVTYVSNFTDVDDKIIKEAKLEGITEKELTDKYIKAYLEDVKKLGSKTDYMKPRVTEYMPKIIDFIDRLVKCGAAYIVGGDVFFSVDSVKEYGALSNRNQEDLMQGARIEINDAKRNPNDFVLWKETKEGIQFDSPWSKGRPGWHTECVTMIESIFNSKIDIHGGGTDLIFPHHENEIAQSCALNHHNIANYWVHNGRLNLAGEKMSKSLGNVILVKDLKMDPLAFRLLILSTYYRQMINFSDDLIDQYEKVYQRIRQAYNQLFLILDVNDAFNRIETNDSKALMDEFIMELDNDINTPNALTVLDKTVKLINQKIRSKDNINELLALFDAFSNMLEILGVKPNKERMSKENKDLYNDWLKAREEKDFQKADELRVILSEKGVI